MTKIDIFGKAAADGSFPMSHVEFKNAHVASILGVKGHIIPISVSIIRNSLPQGAFQTSS